jgi:hypothetical protein
MIDGNKFGKTFFGTWYLLILAIGVNLSLNFKSYLGLIEFMQIISSIDMQNSALVAWAEHSKSNLLSCGTSILFIPKTQKFPISNSTGSLFHMLLN